MGKNYFGPNGQIQESVKDCLGTTILGIYGEYNKALDYNSYRIVIETDCGYLVITGSHDHGPEYEYSRKKKSHYILRNAEDNICDNFRTEIFTPKSNKDILEGFCKAVEKAKEVEKSLRDIYEKCTTLISTCSGNLTYTVNLKKTENV